MERDGTTTLRGIGYALGMTSEALQSLIDYHYWARDRLLDSVEQLTPEQFCRDLGNSFDSIRGTLVHLVSAERAWCARWRGESPTGQLVPTEFETAGDVRARWLEEEARLREFVAQLGPDGVNRVVRYTQFDGSPRNSVFWQTLQHVVNHAAYHRGQVTTMLRQLGGLPPRSQDLIAFYGLSER